MHKECWDNKNIRWRQMSLGLYLGYLEVYWVKEGFLNLYVSLMSKMFEEYFYRFK